MKRDLPRVPEINNSCIFPTPIPSEPEGYERKTQFQKSVGDYREKFPGLREVQEPFNFFPGHELPRRFTIYRHRDPVLLRNRSPIPRPDSLALVIDHSP